MIGVPVFVFLSLIGIIGATPKCGQTPIAPNITTNIIGGTDAIPYSWPWQILLYQDEKFECSGSVISDRWILTAGHCVTNFSDHNFGVLSPEIIRIKTGVYKLHDDYEPDEWIWYAKSIIRHPEFLIKEPNILNDIALIEVKFALAKLDIPIIFHTHVQPICLPSKDSEVIIEPNTAWATGWGHTDESPSDTSENLQQVNLPFVNFETCFKDYDSINVVEEQHVCAGKDFKGGCHGDSGGPLVVKNENNAWFTYGIASAANSGCKTHNQPTVFTRVTTFCNFIEESTKGAAACQDPSTYA